MLAVIGGMCGGGGREQLRQVWTLTSRDHIIVEDNSGVSVPQTLVNGCPTLQFSEIRDMVSFD